MIVPSHHRERGHRKTPEILPQLRHYETLAYVHMVPGSPYTCMAPWDTRTRGTMRHGHSPGWPLLDP
jgi:hypothetical protein